MDCFAFYVTTLSFEFNSTQVRFFIIVFLGTPRLLKFTCTPDRYFRARLLGAPKAVSTPFGRLQETRNRVLGVSTTRNPMAKVVIAFCSRYRVADANSISVVP